jgi:hypothetical protein
MGATLGTSGPLKNDQLKVCIFFRGRGHHVVRPGCLDVCWTEDCTECAHWLPRYNMRKISSATI